MTPHVMQFSLEAYVVVLAKRPSPQTAQNFHSRYEDFSCLGTPRRWGACVIPHVMQTGLNAKCGHSRTAFQLSDATKVQGPPRARSGSATIACAASNASYKRA